MSTGELIPLVTPPPPPPETEGVGQKAHNQPQGSYERGKAADLASLDDRLGLLSLARVGLGAAVVASAAFVPWLSELHLPQAAVLASAYLGICGALEWYRRARRPARMRLQRVTLPIDAAFLVLCITPSGGIRSPLDALLGIQLVSVTLLASPMWGLRSALWDSFFLICVPVLSLDERIGRLLGDKAVMVPSGSALALSLMGLWALTLCTAAFSTISEREIRSSKAQVAALAAMAAEMETTGAGEESILRALLRNLVGPMPFCRGALWYQSGRISVAMVLEGEGKPIKNVDVPPFAPSDRCAVVAMEASSACLLRSLDPQADQAAAALLPAARNVAVIAIRGRGESDHVGLVLLEHGGDPKTTRLPKRTVALLEQFARHASLALRNAQLLSERERLAAQDGLTGLANRREFDRVLTVEVRRSSRTGEPLSLVLLDVDNFKALNDTLGHLAGDRVLQELARVVHTSVSSMDLTARYGGEEFAVILPRCQQVDAVKVVERIARAAQAAPGLAGVTFSAGVATYPYCASDPTGLLRAADEALYESKRAGRNRYSLAPARAWGVSGIPSAG